ncbi:MAG: dihydropteroate synthase [Pseudohongiellaceae bacterium]|jgi:dihydropteroate synthase
MTDNTSQSLTRRNSEMNCGGVLLDLSKPHIMGVLNVTPDSFSDGGQLEKAGSLDLDKVLHRVDQMLVDGASVIDVGGESTRPGAELVCLTVEMDRVLPVVEAVKRRFDTIISIDTSSPELMLEAAALGAGLLNDVRALERKGAIEAAVKTGLPVCLMHMQGSPEMMQNNPQYKNVLSDVATYLQGRAEACVSAGMDRKNIMIDPGFGFGKTVQHNLQLLKNLQQLTDLGFPVLVGLSRKSVIGKVLGRDVGKRLAGSLALALMAVINGASIIRVHDVAETADALKLYQAVSASRNVTI